MAREKTTTRKPASKKAALAPTTKRQPRKAAAPAPAPEPVKPAVSHVSAAPPETAPKPLPGSGNRFSYQSVSPADAYHYAALATGLELDFGNDEKAMRKYRSRLYQINKEFSGKWRFRTIREGSTLMIWRLAY